MGPLLSFIEVENGGIRCHQSVRNPLDLSPLQCFHRLPNGYKLVSISSFLRFIPPVDIYVHSKTTQERCSTAAPVNKKKYPSHS